MEKTNKEQNAYKETDSNLALRQLKAATKMTTLELAYYFEISPRTVENWLCGRTEAPAYLVKLMEYKLRKEGRLPQEELDVERIVLSGSHIAGQYEALKRHYMEGKIRLDEDIADLLNAAVNHNDRQFCKLLKYDQRFDYYISEIAKGKLVKKPDVLSDLKTVAAIRDVKSVKQINQAIAESENR